MTNFCIYILISLLITYEVSADDKAAAEPDVDNGEANARPARMVLYQGYDLGETVPMDLIDQDVPELIPIAENRKARGNGADLSAEEIIGAKDFNENGENALAEANNEGGNTIDLDVEAVAETEPDYQDRAVREPAPDPKTESEKFATESVVKACLEDGDSCSENAGCCSRFCSWTRGFICYSL